MRNLPVHHLDGVKLLPHCPLDLVNFHERWVAMVVLAPVFDEQLSCGKTVGRRILLESKIT